MKKFKVAPQAAKRIKAIIATAMALTLAVPTVSYFSSKSASSSVDAEETVDVPAPIMTVDFENGFLGEREENGLEVVKSEEVLKFEEEKDEKGNYIYENGKQVFGVTDKPFIEAGEYKKGVVGNQPTTAYDEEMGNVLSLDGTVTIPEYVKKYSDALDDKYPIGTVLQEEVVAESQIKLNNPFKGMTELHEEYDEETGWTKGVSISYWVKAAEETDEEGNVTGGVNSSIINFNNETIVTMQKDDYMKYQACQEYSESDERYSMGQQMILTDEDGNQYEVYTKYGVLIRFNPNYPLNSLAGDSSFVEGGWYIPEESSKVKVTAYDEDGKAYGICSLAGETTIDVGLYDEFAYKYAEEDDLENGYSSISRIREEAIKGSMSISTSNDFVFRGDNYKVEEQEDGTKVAVQGTKVTNPNTKQYKDGEEFSQFDVYNQFYFNGDATALELDEETSELTWHFVTVVIQNDMVYFYVDGEWIDPEESYRYCAGTSNEGDFQMYNAGKAFNQGRGIGYNDGFIAYPESNVAEWSADGTANESPANSVSITMLDWLIDEGTELYIGGNGLAANCDGIDMDYGTADGTLLDDISFYDVPLTEEQAKALYENSKAAKEAEPAMAELETFTFEDGTMTGTNGTTLTTVESNIAEPSIVSDATRGNVLKIENSKASGTSAVKLSTNPFANADLKGATVNFWVKEPGQGAKNTVTQSVAVSFRDTMKVKDYDKMATTLKGTEATSNLYINTACDAYFYEGSSSLIYQSLGNNCFFSTKRGVNTDPTKAGFEQADLDAYNEWTARLQTMSSWHMVTMVMENSGFRVYLDGEELSNNMYDKGTDAPNFFGPRFYDGYYSRIYDGYSFDKNNCGSNNQFSIPMLTFLSDETTSAYIGYSNKLGSNTSYETTKESYFDDIAYYATALSSEQIKGLYEAQKKDEVAGGDGSSTGDGSDNNGGNVEQPAGPSDSGNTGSAGGTIQGDKITFNYGGVKVEAGIDVLPADVELVLGMLGTASDADVYAAFNKLAEANEDFNARELVVYTIKASDASITPNGKFKVTFAIPEGYTNVVVMGEDGTIYEGVLSEDGKSITIETTKFGNYAIVDKDMSTDDGSEVAAASTTAGKTGDTSSSVVLPIVVIAAAGAALAIVYKKRKVGQN